MPCNPWVPRIRKWTTLQGHYSFYHRPNSCFLAKEKVSFFFFFFFFNQAHLFSLSVVSDHVVLEALHKMRLTLKAKGHRILIFSISKKILEDFTQGSSSLRDQFVLTFLLWLSIYSFCVGPVCHSSQPWDCDCFLAWLKMEFSAFINFCCCCFS